MKGFGRRLHYSVFRCDLSHKGEIELEAELTELINHKEDRIMIINLGPTEANTEERITFIGHHPKQQGRDAIIV